MEPVNVSAGGSGLLSVGSLFSSAWKMFKERWKVLLGLGFLPAAVALVIMFLAMVGDSASLFDQAAAGFGLIAVIVVLGLIAVVVSIASSAAQVFIAGNERHTPFREAFRWGLSRVVPMITLGVLQCILAFLVLLPFLLVWAVLYFVLGGLGQATPEIALGVLIVSILALGSIYVFFGLRLMFVWPLVALNESTALESFKKSWRLTRGRFWPLLGRVVAAFAVSWAVSMVLGFIPIVGSLFQVVISAYLVVYVVLLFRSTQHAAGASPVMPAPPIVPAPAK